MNADDLNTRERISSGQRCPYCHDEVSRTAAAVACTSCGSVHHRECFEERGACSIFGCASEKTDEVALSGTVLRAYRESHERARSYETSVGFSIALLLLCIVGGGGIVLAVATANPTFLVGAVGILLPLLVLYLGSRVVAFGLQLIARR